MREGRKHLSVLIAYALGALGLTYPLAGNWARTLPGVEGDMPSFVWALGWMRRALELGVNPFASDYVFYPLGGATQLLWAGSLMSVLALPLQSACDLVTAYNAMYWLATVLTAYGTYLLARQVLAQSKIQPPKSTIYSGTLPPFQTLLVVQFVTLNATRLKRYSSFAAFVAGLIFAFAPLRLGYGLAFFNLFNTQFIPFYVLFLLRATRTHAPRDLLCAGLFLGLNVYVDFQIAAFLILLTALYAVYLIALEWREMRKEFVGWLISWSVIGVVSWAVAAPMLFFIAQDFMREGGNYIRVFPVKYSTDRAYDAFAYVLPHARSALYANTPLKIAGVNTGASPSDESALSPDRQSFLGYTVIALAVYALVRRWRRALFWLLVALVFALFSFGPYLHWANQLTSIPLPFLTLHQIPIINHIRIPMRYGIVVVFACAMLAAFAIDDVRLRISALAHAKNDIRYRQYLLRFALVILPALILAEAAILPYPTQSFTVPEIYETIAREPGSFTVLEIPTFNWRAAAKLEAYQAIHGKRILRAYTNRIAPELADYFAYRGTPIIVRSLRILEGAEKGTLDASDLAEDKQVREEVIRFFDLRYALVHRDFLTPEQTRALDAYLREVLGAQFVSDDGVTIAYSFPVSWANDRTHIDLRDLIGQLYVGRGWQFEYPKANWEGEFDFVWTRGAQSEIFLVADDTRARTMTLYARAESPLRATVFLNDTRVGEIALTREWQHHSIVLPKPVSGMNRVRLDWGRELKQTVGVTTITIQ